MGATARAQGGPAVLRISSSEDLGGETLWLRDVVPALLQYSSSDRSRRTLGPTEDFY